MAKIVIVDDEPVFRRLLCAKLTSVGHSVFEASNGKLGEKLILAEKPDLVLLDVWMPEQDGIATIVNLRKHAPDVKIIVMSGQPAGAGLRLFEIAGTLGASATLAKPFAPDALIKAIDDALA
ncbi:MAG: response regulator [Chthoniobacteraceae bacterium]